MGESVQRYRLSWESFGHNEVKGEAERVDRALEAVADAVAEVTHQASAGRRPLDAYGQEMDDTRRRAKQAEDAIDDLARSQKDLEGASGGASGGLGELNDQINAGLKPFDEAMGRVGQFNNALMLLSGAGLVAMFDGVKTAITGLYEMTEAGQAAKRQADALASAFGEVAAQIDELTTTGRLTDLAARQFVNLAAATAAASAEQGAYEEAIQEAAEVQLAFNEAQDEHVRVTKAAAAGTLALGESTFETGRIVARTGFRVAELTKEAEKARAALAAKQRAVDQVRESLLASKSAQADYIGQLRAETEALAANIVAQAEYRFAMARGGKAAESMLDVLSGLVVVGLDVADSIGEKAAKGFETQASASLSAAAAARQQAAALEELYQAQLRQQQLELDAEGQLLEVGIVLEPVDPDLIGETIRSLERVLDDGLRRVTGIGDALGIGSMTETVVEDLGGLFETLVPLGAGIGGALGQALADGVNEGLARIGSIGEALGIGDVEPEFGELFAMFDSLAEHAGAARSVLGDISSTVSLMGQMASLESSNTVQRAKNRARDAKGEKERLAAEKAVLKAEREAERERRRFQAIDFALKAADNVGAAIEEAGKAAGSYPDPAGIAMHSFAALKHGAAAAFYGSGAVSAGSAPSSVGGGGGLGGTPSAPTPADNPRREQGGSSSSTTIILNGVMADGRSVRTAVVDGLNAVGDGQLPVEEGV